MAGRTKRSPCVVALVAMGLTIVLAAPVRAVESYGVGAIPAHPRPDNPRTKSIFVYESLPGSTTRDAVKVINNTTEQRTIKVYAVDSQHSSDGAFACAQAADDKKEVGSWLKLEQNEVTLAPNTNQEIAFTLTVPAHAETGEHNGCIAIEDYKAPVQKMGNGIVLTFRSALRVAVTIPGKIVANITYTHLLQSEQKDKLVVSPVLRNTGNVSVDASVRVLLKTIFNTTAVTSEGTFVVLNKDESRFNFELAEPFWGGWYQLQTDATYAPLKQDSTTANQQKTAQGPSRWLFISPRPAALLVYIIAVLLVVIGTTYFVLRRRQFKLMHQTTSTYSVQPGDNLQALADTVNIDWRKLAKLNHLKPPYSLKAGQTIQLPKRQTHKPRKVKNQV